MPLAPAYDKALKSRIADVANVGGRPAGSVTAAQFLQRFVKEGTPWVHLDIAGRGLCRARTASSAPKGATGWGVRALDRLIRDTLPGLSPLMAEVLFYHLTSSPLEASLPEMLERSLARGWRVVAALRLGGGPRGDRRDALDLPGRRLPAARHGGDGPRPRCSRSI